MTYKELVNAVLARLREDSVGSVTETAYSTLVGSFVNDAKRVVEDAAWPWRALIRTVNLSVLANTQQFFDLEDYTTVEDSGQLNTRARLYLEPGENEFQAYISTLNYERKICVAPRSYNKVQRLSDINHSTSGELTDLIVSTNASAANGKTSLRLLTYPAIPNRAETIELSVLNPQNALTNDSTVLLVPEDPVIQLAYLYCLYERGEEIGEMLTLTQAKAEIALSDAIMLESMQTSDPTFRVD